jgi:hypothetical protein
MFIALKHKKPRAPKERHVSRGITKHISLLTERRGTARDDGYKHLAPPEQRRWLMLLLVLTSLSLLTRIAHADGGVVVCRRTLAPFNVTVFFTEMPLRPGPADLSVLVEDTHEHSLILDAQVLIELEHEAGTIIRAEATRTQARNKVLYCSLIDLPAAGQWKMKVHVRHRNNAAEIVSDLVVLDPQPVLLSYWQLIAAPPLIIILFLLNQWLRRGPFNSQTTKTFQV